MLCYMDDVVVQKRGLILNRTSAFSDHKALIYMLNPEKAMLSPPRIQRLGLRLQAFDYRIEHMVGKSNVADSLRDRV